MRSHDGAVQPGNMGFHVKMLDEIRAEKRKRKSEEKPPEEKTQSMSVNTRAVCYHGDVVHYRLFFHS